MISPPQVYQAPAWLPGGHLQTIYPYFFIPLPIVPYRRERWETPDGDFIDLDWMDGPQDAPLVVLFHGLEGDSRGHYAASLMHKIRDAGWRGVVPHFRGCSGVPNRLPRAYHSGDAGEIAWVLNRLREANPGSRIHAAGVSLGGNALLKWLGSVGEHGNSILDAAAAISAPVNLHAAARALDRGFNRLTYTKHFLRTLKVKALAKIDQHRLPLARGILADASTFREFDEAFTAPIHGFAGADDYWTRSSSKADLYHIRVPTLLIHARNDPFLPASALPGQEDVSPSVTLEYPEHGGHAGFVSGPFPGNLSWLPSRLLHHFSRYL